MKSVPSADAVIVGGGLVGLACAAVLARDGSSAILLDDARHGKASSAAAGMLAPSIDRARGAANDFAVAARDAYPSFAEWLEADTGIGVSLNTLGILQVALSEAGVRGLRRAMARDEGSAAQWLDTQAVRTLEPALSHALGAVLHPQDGAVDNTALLAALDAYCTTAPGIVRVSASAVALATDGSGMAIRTANGDVYRARYAIIASGAWVATTLAGLPRAIPVAPLRGQMIAYEGAPIRHVIFGPRGYLVPRPASVAGAAETLIGATSEETGFDTATTTGGAERLRSVAEEILPAMAAASPSRHWAGLRPMTPDLLPIIGPDPDQPALLYACGHSRNGILMAPLTAECVSATVRDVPAPHDLAPFSIARFAR